MTLTSVLLDMQWNADFKDTSMHHWKYKPVKLMKQEIKNELI